MNRDIKEIFNSVQADATEFASALRLCCAKIYAELPQNYEENTASERTFTFLEPQLAKGVDTLCESLAHPTLVLATTGTTSSGKSTLVNLLCGAEIMPVAVQEMSAGVVTIEYSDQQAIKIDQTVGATWECGIWRNVSSEEIYSRLDKVMKSYLESKIDGDSVVACPQSTVYYPFRLVAEPGLLDLPEGTTVKIMDLPGLAHVGDEGNAEVIRKSREALCLVTYNSSETDKEKVSSLLQEIVDQVKELGGSPGRMLFILNRIDVFRDDRDWPKSETAFVERTDQEIRRKLKENLSEYSDAIDRVRIVKLSSLPALLSLLIMSEKNEEKVAATNKLDKRFNFLIPEEIQDDLPRRADKWSKHERKRVSEAVLLEANANQFHQHLKQHIQDEYPQLIIPQIVKKFKDTSANPLVEWSSQTTSAVVNSSEESYRSESERIQTVREQLSQSLFEKNKILKDSFNEIRNVVENVSEGTFEKPGLAEGVKEGFQDPFLKIENIVTERLVKEEQFSEISNRFVPLYDWSRAVSLVVDNVISATLDSIQDGTPLENGVFEMTSSNNVSLLRGRIEDLRDENFSIYSGKRFVAKDSQRKNQLQKLNRRLNNLSAVLKIVMDDIVEKTLDRETGRIKDTLECLFSFHLGSLEKGARVIAPDLGISFPQTELVAVEFDTKPSFSFESGFPIIEEKYDQQVSEFSGTKRVWWTVWLWEKNIYESKSEERTSDNAKIPSFDDLERGWTLQKNKGQLDVVRQVSNWWVDQLDQFSGELTKFQDKLLDRYQERLDQAHSEMKTEYEKRMEVWQPLKEEAELIAARAEPMGKAWMKDERLS